MVTLLTLPREVRDEILEFVIFARTPSPKTLADLEAQLPKRKDPPTWSGYFGEEHPIEMLQTAPSLLLLNKQIHYETKELLNLRRGITYELDVNLVCESIMVPHWTCIPLAMDIVPVIKVSLQSIGKFREDGSFRGQPVRDPRELRSSTIPLYVSKLYSLLRDLLYADPDVRLQAEGLGRKGIACRVLEIDCMDPENQELLAPESHNPGEYALFQVRRRILESLPSLRIEEWLVRPEWLAANISEYLPRRILEGFYFAIYGQRYYDAPFCSRVGRIVIKVNGSWVASIDVGQIMADIKFSQGSASQSPVEIYLDHWFLWKEKAIEARKDRGFRVAELPSDWKEKIKTAYHYRPGIVCTDDRLKLRFETLSDQLDFI
jgi:hypothetical protein